MVGITDRRGIPWSLETTGGGPAPGFAMIFLNAARSERSLGRPGPAATRATLAKVRWPLESADTHNLQHKFAPETPLKGWTPPAGVRYYAVA